MMKAPWSRMPLLLPAILLVAGVVCGINSWGIYFASTTGVVAIALFFSRFKIIAFSLMLCAVGTINAYLRIETEAPVEYIGVTNMYQADITQSRIGDTSQTLTLRVTHAGVDSAHMQAIKAFDATITVPSFDIEYEAMHTIRFVGQFSATQSEHDLPDEITAADIQLKNRIFMHCVTPNDSIKQILPTKGLIPALRRYRSDASQILLQSDLRPRTKEFLCTALLGDATIIDTEVRADFASAGLAHILALSGLHVGLIVMLVSLTLWPLKIVGGGTVRTIIVILLLWLYAVFTGLGASVVRSVLMLSVYFGAKILQRQSSGYNSLCFAIIVILLADPASLFSIGFQLSFSAVASILLFANTINPISQRNRLAYNTMSLACVSLSAMMGTALISCIYFHNLPVYFLLANVAITLLLPWLIGGGAILMILEWCGCNPEWLYCFIDTLYNMVEGTARWVSSLPSATICHIYLPAWILLPYTAVIALLKLWLHNRRTWTAISAIGAAGIAAACIIFIPRTNEPPTMYVTRTTYHTNIVAYTPNEQPVMITTATNADLGANMYRANRKYIHFLGRRGYDSLHHGGHRHITNNWVWNRPWLDTGLRFIALISHDSLLRKPPKQVSHALICRGYRGNIKRLNDILRPDSIVLSYDLHPKRAKRYETECDSLKIPYRNMREDGSWQFPINSR